MVDIETLQVKSNDVIIVKYDPNKLDFEDAKNVHEMLRAKFPRNLVLGIVKGVEFTSIEKAAVRAYIDKYLDEEEY